MLLVTGKEDIVEMRKDVSGVQLCACGTNDSTHFFGTAELKAVITGLSANKYLLKSEFEAWIFSTILAVYSFNIDTSHNALAEIMFVSVVTATRGLIIFC